MQGISLPPSLPTSLPPLLPLPPAPPLASNLHARPMAVHVDRYESQHGRGGQQVGDGQRQQEAVRTRVQRLETKEGEHNGAVGAKDHKTDGRADRVDDVVLVNAYRLAATVTTDARDVVLHIRGGTWGGGGGGVRAWNAGIGCTRMELATGGCG